MKSSKVFREVMEKAVKQKQNEVAVPASCMVDKELWLDKMENKYRRTILRPHRKKHEYPKFAMSCQKCTPCVRDIFEYLKEQR